jgi:hypothetical protein
MKEKMARRGPLGMMDACGFDGLIDRPVRTAREVS